jgi:hypothetical protein
MALQLTRESASVLGAPTAESGALLRTVSVSRLLSGARPQPYFYASLILSICQRYAGVCFIFSFFFISHTAWVIVFKHGNKPSRLDKKVSFVGLRKTTYTPVHASSIGLGSLYQPMIAEGKPGSLQWTSATA